ncbi:Helix-turn-helix domain protein [Polystyrenella longa]|uniref:Helix-turn-helix domain protein n=1 Tax=Polystyrenella longa TaxID=2528007 RepID=A0A518CTS1_9PLAN|nr:helix-turn-helix domain-containing protein [Polystyrenella longa]QDU82631.1 Helix-turn-helix domain protein [Polystyrenella longa]
MLYTVQEAAEKLSLSPACVYNMVNTGTIPHRRIGEKRTTIRFTEEDLETYLESCRHGTVESMPEQSKPRRSTARPVLKHLKF